MVLVLSLYHLLIIHLHRDHHCIVVETEIILKTTISKIISYYFMTLYAVKVSFGYDEITFSTKLCSKVGSVY